MLETLTASLELATPRNAERRTHRGESATSAVTVSAGGSGANWYVYCSNNPLSYKDPTGLLDRVINDMSNAPLGGTLTMTSAFGLRPDPFSESWNVTSTAIERVQVGETTFRTVTNTLEADPAVRHSSVDLTSSEGRGTNVLSISEGQVVAKGYDPIYGLYEQVRSGDTTFQYSHLGAAPATTSNLDINRAIASLPKSVGSPVFVGSTLGTMGSTGSSTGPHLDLSATVNGARVDPASYLGAGVRQALQLRQGVQMDNNGTFSNQIKKTESSTYPEVIDR